MTSLARPAPAGSAKAPESVPAPTAVPTPPPVGSAPGTSALPSFVPRPDSGSGADLERVVAHCRDGALRGKLVPVPASGADTGEPTRPAQVVRWSGIRYGLPINGLWAFAAARRPPPWGETGSGAVDAVDPGPAAPGPPGAVQRLLGEPEQPTGADCLRLHVTSPAADEAARPVLVWVHGGGFVSGSGAQPWFDGTSFAAGGVVVVTVNYRLGALGFLDLGPGLDPDSPRSGGSARDDGEEPEGGLLAANRALFDLVAALTWVRDNIAAFGGDPESVTLAGQSAGAMCVGALLGMPAARGLFHRAVLQSGACHTYFPDRAAAAEVTRRMVDAAGVAHPRDLARLPAEALVAAQSKVRAPDGGPAFRPVAGTASLPVPPLDAVAAGAASGVDLIVGTNRDEMWTFAAIDPGLVERAAGMMTGILDAGCVGRPGAGQAAAVLDALGDAEFRIPAAALADAQSRHATVFTYRFDWASSALDGRLGAGHTVEIPFVFDSVRTAAGRAVTGGLAPASLVERVHGAWAAFVRTGVPAAPGLPAWPCHDPADPAGMVLDDACRVAPMPLARRRGRPAAPRPGQPAPLDDAAAGTPAAGTSALVGPDLPARGTAPAASPRVRPNPAPAFGDEPVPARGAGPAWTSGPGRAGAGGGR